MYKEQLIYFLGSFIRRPMMVGKKKIAGILNVSLIESSVSFRSH
jgi:hypothetical protein